MIHFAQPAYLWLLLLIPLFFAVYGLSLARRRRRMERLGDKELVEALMPEASTGKGWLKTTLFAVAWLFFTIALARPQLGARLMEHESKGVEVMIALDVSNSMMAEDYSPNRLERSKLAVSRIVDRLSGDRVGLVVFAGQAFVQLPITTDYVSAKIFLKTIDTGSVPVQGTDLSEAISTCARGFSVQSERSRAIILITDGEGHEGDPVGVASTIAGTGIRIFCIGVGSPEGKPIPDGSGGLIKDRDGNIVVSRLDETVLRRIASEGNGAYVRAGNSEFGLNPILDEIRKMDKEAFESVVFSDFDEQFMYFLAAALVFLLLEFITGERRWRRKLMEMEDEL